jgi:hypothetical protein
LTGEKKHESKDNFRAVQVCGASGLILSANTMSMRLPLDIPWHRPISDFRSGVALGYEEIIHREDPVLYFIKVSGLSKEVFWFGKS